jgi:hypothetical protein
MAKAIVLECTPTPLIGLRLVDDVMALHLCSYTRDIVLKKATSFFLALAFGFRRASGVQKQGPLSTARQLLYYP